MADLVSGAYGQKNPLQAIIGLPGNGAQSDIPVRSNTEYLGYVPVDTTAVLVSGSTTFVAVPCNSGTQIATVTMAVGNTAASTPTHFSVALYSGVLTTAKLLGTQSTDSTTTAITANTPLVVALGATYTVQDADVPYGYLYVGLGYTGTASPSALGTTGSTKDQAFKASSIFVNKPLVCGTQAVGGAGTNAATVTLASNTSQAAIPYIWLS